MIEIFAALQRSLATLKRGKVWLYVFAPAVVALLFMILLSFFLLDRLTAYFLEMPPMTWITTMGALWLTKLLAFVGGWVLIISASYLLAVFLASVMVMPLMLNSLSETDYRDLAKLGKDNFAVSTWKSILAVLLFMLGWLLTFPLWLIPGLALIQPLFWMAWLNRRTFSYDALSMHATLEEQNLLQKEKKKPLLMLGLIIALVAYVPVIGLLTPSLAALAYVHYCLEALRQLRQGAVVAVIQSAKQE